MKSHKLFFLLVIILSFHTLLLSQEVLTKILTGFQNSELDALFTKYEVVEIDYSSLAVSLSTRSNIKPISIKTSTRDWNLNLLEYDLLSPSYFLKVAGTSGIKLFPRNKGLRTFKVSTSNPRSGLSALTISKDFFYGFIEEAGVKYFIEPLYVFKPEAPRNMLVIYNENDIKPHSNKVCGVDHLNEKKYIVSQDQIPSSVQGRSSCYAVDIALSCDKSVYDFQGGVPETEAFMIGVLNLVQTNWDNEFSAPVEFSLSTVFIPTTTADDPWNGINDINTHLEVHRDWANGGGYGASYAVATSWTRKYTSGVVGLGWLGSICTSQRYNVCSDFGSTAQGLRVLQSHELGHNFNALHDPSGNYIMRPLNYSADTWSAASIAAINSFLPSRGCLGSCSSGSPPEAIFLGSPTFVCANESVKFSDLSSNSPSNWNWAFAGGTPSISTLQHPVVTYKTRGIFDVSLQAGNSYGNDISTYNNYIQVEQKPNLSNFSFNLVERVLTISQIQHQYGESFLWKFGDGSSSTEEFPVHEYLKDGSYLLELIVTNRCGSTSKTLTLNVVTPVTAEFSSDLQKGCGPLTVNYKNLSSENATSYEWEFPGGIPEKSSLKNPSVLYQNSGNYDVVLTVRNSAYSEQRKYSNFISIHSLPKPTFQHNINGLSVFFKNQTLSADSFFWDFGDRLSSAEKEPTHVYIKEGDYKVKLTATNLCGNADSEQDVTVLWVPRVGFKANSPICAGDSLAFQDESSRDVTSWFWDFGVGQPGFSTDRNPSVVFSKSGLYTIKLTVKNSNGENSIVKTDYVEVKSPTTCPKKSKSKGKIGVPEDEDDNIAKSLEERILRTSESTIQINPNPCSDELIFKVNGSKLGEYGTLQIFNCSGQMIFKHNDLMKTYESYTIDLKSFPSGVYILQFNDGESNYTSKFLIIK